MRVITGSARGVQLKTPDGMLTRPTTDRVKEALFSIIHFEIPGAEVLDLFGGTGQLGIEALSRGAKNAVFVDAQESACKIIRENLKRAKFEKEGYIRETAVEGRKRTYAITERGRHAYVGEVDRLCRCLGDAAHAEKEENEHV